ncbi:MAG: SCO family protein [Paracoccaceae bacterium]
MRGAIRPGLIGLAGLAVALGLGAALWMVFDATPELVGPGSASIDARDADIGGGFTMTAHTGEQVSYEALTDGPALFYFGYTFCPDVCPFDAQDMAAAVDLLAEDGIEVTPVFVTVDPERDTPEQLGYFVEAMHPAMVGLSPDAETLARVADDWKVYFQKASTEGGGEDYLMNHTSFTYLVLPDEGVVRLFRTEQDAGEIAREIRAEIEAAG